MNVQSGTSGWNEGALWPSWQQNRNELYTESEVVHLLAEASCHKDVWGSGDTAPQIVGPAVG